MELIEKVARALFANDDKWANAIWSAAPERIKAMFRSDAKAAIRAMLDGVEPVAFLFEHRDAGGEFSFDPLEQIGMSKGWTETPLYSLDALKEALDHD